MNDDFVPFELAVKLKEKGLNIPFYFFYRNDDKLIHHVMVGKSLVYCDEINDEVVCASTIPQVLKWLREEKKIYVSILPFATYSTINKVAFYYLIEYNSTGETMEGIEQNTYCAEWKDAALAGIEYVLNNLI